MHFALPPRKTSHPPPYARAAARDQSNRRRSQLQALGLAILGLFTLWVLVRAYLNFSSSGRSSMSSDVVQVEPSIVIVTILDQDTMSEDYIRRIKTNRDDYAARHGYATFYTNTSTYSALYSPSPKSWSLVPALRHALTLHPSATHLWSLTPHALITTPTISLQSHILSPSVLPNLMRKDIPVVPPDSVIHTFSHLTPPKVDLILSQDIDNLAQASLILRNTEWSQYFLDAWFDPLYRAYNFQKAEGHALEHIVQWHPTILAKLVLVEQRLMNSYNFKVAAVQDRDTGLTREVDSMWQEGDLVVNFKGCDEEHAGEETQRSCENEMKEYYVRWEKEIEKLDGANEMHGKAKGHKKGVPL